MGLTKDNETPALLAEAIHHHHQRAEFRLALVRELLLQLHDDMVEAGFPTGALVMDLADGGIADVTAAIADPLDAWLSQRAAEAAVLAAADANLSLSAATAAIVADTSHDSDNRFAISRPGAYWVGVRVARETIEDEPVQFHGPFTRGSGSVSR